MIPVAGEDSLKAPDAKTLLVEVKVKFGEAIKSVYVTLNFASTFNDESTAKYIKAVNVDSTTQAETNILKVGEEHIGNFELTKGITPFEVGGVAAGTSTAFTNTYPPQQFTQQYVSLINLHNDVAGAQIVGAKYKYGTPGNDDKEAVVVVTVMNGTVTIEREFTIQFKYSINDVKIVNDFDTAYSDYKVLDIDPKTGQVTEDDVKEGVLQLNKPSVSISKITFAPDLLKSIIESKGEQLQTSTRFEGLAVGSIFASDANFTAFQALKLKSDANANDMQRFFALLHVFSAVDSKVSFDKALSDANSGLKSVFADDAALTAFVAILRTAVGTADATAQVPGTVLKLFNAQSSIVNNDRAIFALTTDVDAEILAAKNRMVAMFEKGKTAGMDISDFTNVARYTATMSLGKSTKDITIFATTKKSHIQHVLDDFTFDDMKIDAGLIDRSPLSSYSDDKLYKLIHIDGIPDELVQVTAIVAAEDFKENANEQRLTLIIKAGGYQAIRTITFKFAHTYAEQLLLDFIDADKATLNGNGISASAPKSTNIDYILTSSFDGAAPKLVSASEFKIANPDPRFAALEITQANVRNFNPDVNTATIEFIITAFKGQSIDGTSIELTKTIQKTFQFAISENQRLVNSVPNILVSSLTVDPTLVPSPSVVRGASAYLEDPNLAISGIGYETRVEKLLTQQAVTIAPSLGQSLMFAAALELIKNHHIEIKSSVPNEELYDTIHDRNLPINIF